MTPVGARRHVMLPVDDLVPLPVVREEQEVIVGEPRITRCRLLHVSVLRALIVHRPSYIAIECESRAVHK